MVGWHHRPSGHRFGLGLGSCGWTGRPGVRQSVGSQRVGHDWATELNWRQKALIYLNPGPSTLLRVRFITGKLPSKNTDQRLFYKLVKLQVWINMKNSFFLNWSIVELQYYSSFRCIAEWISCIYTFICSLCVRVCSRVLLKYEKWLRRLLT